MSPNVLHPYNTPFAKLVNTMEHLSQDSVIVQGKGDFTYVTKGLELAHGQELKDFGGTKGNPQTGLSCETVSWNMYFKRATSEVSDGHEEHDKEILNHLREILKSLDIDCQ